MARLAGEMLDLPCTIPRGALGQGVQDVYSQGKEPRSWASPRTGLLLAVLLTELGSTAGTILHWGVSINAA